MGRFYEFPPYITVAERRERAQSLVKKLRQTNSDLSPVVIEGTAIARSVWGKAWCKHLETFADYSNRIPRGRSYVRSNAVVDLKIEKGLVTALVTGSTSRPYKVRMEIDCLSGKRKEAIEALFREPGAPELLDLLQGKIPPALMATLTDPKDGLFPRAKEVKHSCTCPDSAGFCKHQAAVLYGVGNRLDTQPELLFTLRGLDSTTLTAHADTMLAQASVSELGEQDLSALFGVELVEDSRWASPVQQPKKPEKEKPRETPKKLTHLPLPRTPVKKLFYIQHYTGWNIVEMGERLSIKSTNIEKWMTGRGKPTERFIPQIEALYQEVREAVEIALARKRARRKHS